MKRFTAIPAILLLFCSTHIQAQVNNNNHLQQLLQCNRHLMHAIEARQQSQTTASKNNEARTTGESERLIGKSTYDTYNNIGMIDTTYYTYSGNRSSFFDFNTMTFDASNHVTNTFVPQYLGKDLIDVMFDTSVYATQENMSKAVATYDADNNLTQVYGVPLFNIAPAVYNKYDNIYDANGNVTELITFVWDFDNSAWDTSMKRLLAYNGNMITSDSTIQLTNGAWAPQGSWSYEYDNSGNMTTATETNYATSGPSAAQYFFAYNANNTIQKDSIAEYTGSVWTPVYKDSVGYTAGISSVTYERQTYYQGGVAVNYIEATRHFTGAQPDTVYKTSYAAATGGFFSGSYKDSYLYDSYGNPITENEYDFHATSATDGYYSATPDYITYYYYQTFNEAVNTVAKQSVAIKVYPNPATDVINISQTGMQQGTLTHITLINALGQTVRTESLPWMSSTETLSVAGLKPGNYWLVIQDKNGNVLSRKAIVKE